jgi:predicted dehydrogenase
VIINDGVHHFDLWRFLLGAEAVEIYAESARSQHFEDDTCSISARFDSGVLAGHLSFAPAPTANWKYSGNPPGCFVAVPF